MRSPSLIRTIPSALSVAGLKTECIPTEYPGHATALAEAAVREEVDVVMVCGGDGTVNEAVQPLVGSPSDPRAVSKMIVGDVRRQVSVGRAMKPVTGWHRYFLLMAGIGLDATIVSGVDSRLKKWTGVGAYLLAGLDYLARLPQTPFSIEFNGRRHDSTFAVIGNASRYAVWFTLTPEARIDDDKLDICLFNTGSRIAYLNYALRSIAGRHTVDPGVVYEWTREARATSGTSGTGALVQLDGEVVGRLPMSFDVVPKALRIVASV